MRWSSTNNEIVGTCSNHQFNFSRYQVNSHVDVEEMKEALNDGDIHVSTEALVITMLFLDIPKDIPKVVLLLPICSHDCISILETSILFIKSVIDESASKLVNIASDGDGKRRKLF